MSSPQAEDPPGPWVERHFALLLGHHVGDTGAVGLRTSARIDWFSPHDY